MIYRVSKFVTAVAVVLTAQVAAAQNRPFDVPPARTSQSAGAPLTLPSNASPRAVLAQFLRAQGRDQATADSIAETSRATGRQGITHVQFDQRAGGLPVYGTYAKAAFSARGELVHVVENLASVPPRVGRADVNAQQAIDAAVANLYPAFRTIPSGFFRTPPSASRVAIPEADGTMTSGFVVETWTDRTNQLHETLVGGDGATRRVESRTNTDGYNVFRINPNVTTQAVRAGAGSGNAESPNGWLFSRTQGTTNIAGNNANAYLDVISDNRSDSSGDPIIDGNFLTVANLTAAPSTAENRAVAVQNLFYLNNLIHDVLYRHGFTEGNLNFQENNFGKGGRGSDGVYAEAQDGGGTDNANFATPRDGQNPRMQMYLWTGKGTHEVLAGGLEFLAQGAEFGPALTIAGVSGNIVLVNDGTGTATDGCESFSGVGGAVALIDRGTCAFTVKVKNAQNAGAVAVIVANNTGGDEIMTMGGTDSTITIPSVFISQNSGNAIKAMQLPTPGVVRLADAQPLQRDGDVDADIVFHEYCHGLTWRIIGGMNGPIAGAIGEGMSDVCALLLTAVGEDGNFTVGADAVGEYSFSSSRGIRRYRYDGYPRTYGQIEGASVHDDGEVYGAIGWRLLELFGRGRADDLFGYMVDGMNYTPATPTYEQMRDGILQAVAAAPLEAGDRCRVWNAFAQYGVGVGAKATVRRNSFAITESFALPSDCTKVLDTSSTVP